ncbi:Uncharacterised protein [Mycobacterium tuberculosis]|nr:Uncharacterised protein [Mycobacterium tuberculosis]
MQERTSARSSSPDSMMAWQGISRSRTKRRTSRPEASEPRWMSMKTNWNELAARRAIAPWYEDSSCTR